MIKIIAILLVIVVLAYFGISLFIANILAKTYPSTLEVSKDSISPNSEDIAFTTPDNVHLKGWLFKSASKKLIIMVAGVGANRVDVYYNAVGITKFLLDNNYNVLLYDSRGTGLSEIVRPTFGNREINDVIGAVDFAKTQGFSESQIGIISDSLGAITTIMAFPDLPNIRAIVLDSPASVIEPLVTREITKTNHVPSFFVPGIFFMAKTFLGIDIKAVRPIDKVVYKKDTPLLYLHGTADNFIPPQNSEDLFKISNPMSQRVLFPGADHVETFKTNPELYKTTVLKYLAENLK